MRGRGLFRAALVLVLGVALAHGAAARDHQAEAAEHRQMAATLAPGPTQAEMAEHAQLTGRIGGLLAGSTVAGLALAAWGLLILIRWGRHRGQLTGWAAAVLTVTAVFVAAGIASRANGLGLLGHVDVAGPLWAATLTAEILTLPLATATWARARPAAEEVYQLQQARVPV